MESQDHRSIRLMSLGSHPDSEPTFERKRVVEVFFNDDFSFKGGVDGTFLPMFEMAT
jgi:hypothetical protein